MKERYNWLYKWNKRVPSILYIIYAIAVISLLLRVVVCIWPNCCIGKCWYWIMNTEVHTLFSNVVRDSDGKLEPIKLMIETFGGASILFGAVNEVKSNRSLGMMMEDVIGYYFPHHLRIQGVCYFVLTVTGGYACIMNIGITAVICVVGILVCLLYATIMARCVVFSTQLRNELTIDYIQMKMRGALHTQDKSKISEQMGILVLNYARYVSQQWSSGEVLQVRKEWNQAESEITLEAMLVKLAACGLKQDSTCLDLQKAKEENRKKQTLVIVEDFSRLFPCALQYSDEMARYVLYTKALSCAEDPHINQLRNDVRRCSQIWEQLFLEIKEEKGRVSLARAVFGEAKQNQWYIFTLLALGLLEYLGIGNKNQDKTQIMSKADFLSEIVRAECNLLPEERTEGSAMGDTGTEVLYLMAGVLCWMQVWNCIELEKDLIGQVLERVSILASEWSIQQMALDCEKYVVLSYLIVAFENDDQYREMTVRILQKLEPIVRRKLRFF